MSFIKKRGFGLFLSLLLFAAMVVSLLLPMGLVGKAYANGASADISESDATEQLQDELADYVDDALIDLSDSDDADQADELEDSTEDDADDVDGALIELLSSDVTDEPKDELTLLSDGTVEIDLAGKTDDAATKALQDALKESSVDVITLKGAGYFDLTAALTLPAGRNVKIQADPAGSSIKIYGVYGKRHIIVDPSSGAAATSITFSGIVLDGWNYCGGMSFTADASMTLAVDGAVIQNCYNGNAGGGIWSTGNLVVSNSLIINNEASTGGGIALWDNRYPANKPTLKITNTIIGRPNGVFLEPATNDPACPNQADEGGGVFADGPLTIIDSQITGNDAWYSGAGVYATSDLTIKNTTITHNGRGLDPTDGPAIYLEDDTSLVKIDSASTILNWTGEFGAVPVPEGSSAGFLPSAVITYSQTTPTTENIYAYLTSNVPIAMDASLNKDWEQWPAGDTTSFRKEITANDLSPNWQETVNFTSILSGTSGTADIYVDWLSVAIPPVITPPVITPPATTPDTTPAVTPVAVTTAAATTAAITTTASDTAETTAITPVITPLAATPTGDDGKTIVDQAPPLADVPHSHWSLINLLLAGLGLLIAIIILLGRRSSSQSKDLRASAQYKRIAWRVLSIVAASSAVALFVLTQDLTANMVLVDTMTIGHAIFVVIQVLFAILVSRPVDSEGSHAQLA